jgi:hypothetical protein
MSIFLGASKLVRHAGVERSDVGLGLKGAGLADVMLKTWPVFPQVMPSPSEFPPILSIELFSRLSSEPPQLPQVLVQGMRKPIPVVLLDMSNCINRAHLSFPIGTGSPTCHLAYTYNTLSVSKPDTDRTRMNIDFQPY